MTSRSAILLALSAAGLLLGSSCKSSTEPMALPETIHECETYTERVCSTWSRTASGYDAVWDQASEASIVVERFDADSVVFTRTDTSGPTLGGVARYSAHPVGNSVHEGLVTWSHADVTYSGAWDADW